MPLWRWVYEWNPDLNAPAGEGVSCYPINSRDGRRVSTNEAYLEPARNRPNLMISGEALVDRLAIEGRRVRGVIVHLAGVGPVQLAAHEVLLSAGAVHTPAILWRSELGPANALLALGITPARDMPEVGGNFIDHPVVRATIRLRPEHHPVGPDARHTNCCVTYSSGLAGGGRRDMIMIAFNHRGFEPNGAPQPGGVAVSVFETFSRGTVRLRSRRPDHDPMIEADMLSDERDLVRLRDGVRRLAALVATPALSDIADDVSFGTTGLRMETVAGLDDAELDRVLLAQASDAQHASGTCRMTASEEPRGVVDPDGRVKGINGLRIADASIMPFDCRANTHFTTMMIGEAVAARMQTGRTAR